MSYLKKEGRKITDGGFNKKYHDARKKRIDLIYGLNRRTSEVQKIIENKFNKSDYSRLNCLDIGTVDGLMLSKLNNFFRFNKAVGIDISEELIKTNEDKNIKLYVGDAENLHFDNDSFDIIIACAIIEHVTNPNKMLSECNRVLKKGGILIITTPNSFYNWIATKIGYFERGMHLKTFTMKKLQNRLRLNNFEIVFSKTFMFFPFFKIPFENQIEFFIRFIGLGKLIPNQLIVGRK